MWTLLWCCLAGGSLWAGETLPEHHLIDFVAPSSSLTPEEADHKRVIEHHFKCLRKKFPHAALNHTAPLQPLQGEIPLKDRKIIYVPKARWIGSRKDILITSDVVEDVVLTCFNSDHHQGALMRISPLTLTQSLKNLRKFLDFCKASEVSPANSSKHRPLKVTFLTGGLSPHAFKVANCLLALGIHPEIFSIPPLFLDQSTTAKEGLGLYYHPDYFRMMRSRRNQPLRLYLKIIRNKVKPYCLERSIFFDSKKGTICTNFVYQLQAPTWHPYLPLLDLQPPTLSWDRHLVAYLKNNDDTVEYWKAPGVIGDFLVKLRSLLPEAQLESIHQYNSLPYSLPLQHLCHNRTAYSSDRILLAHQIETHCMVMVTYPLLKWGGAALFSMDSSQPPAEAIRRFAEELLIECTQEGMHRLKALPRTSPEAQQLLGGNPPLVSVFSGRLSVFLLEICALLKQRGLTPRTVYVSPILEARYPFPTDGNEGVKSPLSSHDLMPEVMASLSVAGLNKTSTGLKDLPKGLQRKIYWDPVHIQDIPTGPSTAPQLFWQCCRHPSKDLSKGSLKEVKKMDVAFWPAEHILVTNPSWGAIQSKEHL